MTLSTLKNLPWTAIAWWARKAVKWWGIATGLLAAFALVSTSANASFRNASKNTTDPSPASLRCAATWLSSDCPQRLDEYRAIFRAANNPADLGRSAQGFLSTSALQNQSLNQDIEALFQEVTPQTPATDSHYQCLRNALISAAYSRVSTDGLIAAAAAIWNFTVTAEGHALEMKPMAALHKDEADPVQRGLQLVTDAGGSDTLYADSICL